MNTEKDLCRITFETWWVTTFYPNALPDYDNPIDISNDVWSGWKAAWELRGELDNEFISGKDKTDVS